MLWNSASYTALTVNMDFARLKRSAKTGRRAQQHTSKNENDAPPKPEPAPESRQENAPQVPRPSRRTTTTSGWGETTSKNPELEDSRFAVNDDDIENDLNESIQMIPDIEEVHEEDLIQQMAAPPTISMNQVATYRELDSDLLKKSTFQMLDNEIDMKLLAKHLLPESELKESNDAWEWERLFTDVTSKIDVEKLDVKL